MSICQMRNIPFEDKTNSFLLMCDQVICFFLKRPKNQLRMLLQMSIVREGILYEKKVATSTHGERIMTVFMNVFNAKPAATFWTFLFGDQNWHFCCSELMAPIVLTKRREVTPKMKNQLFFEKKYSLITISHTRNCTKKNRNHSIMA